MKNASDVDEMFRIFCRNVSSSVLQHVPFKQTTPGELRLKSKPWINPYIQNMMQYRDRLLSKVDLTLKKQRLHVRSSVIEWQTASERAKSNIFMSFFAQNKGNMKNLKNKSLKQLISDYGNIIKDSKKWLLFFTTFCECFTKNQSRYSQNKEVTTRLHADC